MINVLMYSDKEIVNDGIEANDIAKLINTECTLWIDVDQPTESEWDLLIQTFGLHPLAVKNSQHYTEYPYIEEYDKSLFILTHVYKGNSLKNDIIKKELDIFLGNNWVLTIHRAPLPVIERGRGRILSNPELASSGPDMLLYYLFQEVLDNLVPLVAFWQRKIEALEEKILLGDADSVLEQLVEIRRGVNNLKRCISPLIDQYGQLSYSQRPYISDKGAVYFASLKDRIQGIDDSIEIVRDVISNCYNIYLTVVSNKMNETSFKMNEIIHRLTIVSTIFLPLTFITGWYGMNFHHMPELTWKYGYIAIAIVSGVIAFGLARYFTKKGWYS